MGTVELLCLEVWRQHAPTIAAATSPGRLPLRMEDWNDMNWNPMDAKGLLWTSRDRASDKVSLCFFDGMWERRSLEHFWELQIWWCSAIRFEGFDTGIVDLLKSLAQGQRQMALGMEDV